MVAIEVKSARSVNQRDASGLTFLRDRLGDRFQCGILFHTGPLTARLGERAWAVPAAALRDKVSCKSTVVAPTMSYLMIGNAIRWSIWRSSVHWITPVVRTSSAAWSDPRSSA